MKIINYISAKIPTYALSYLVNGDASGLEDADQANIDQWFDTCRANLAASHPGADISFHYRDTEEGSFQPFPAFGLACDCISGAIVAMVGNDEPGDPLPLPWEPAFTPIIHVSEITARDYVGSLEIETWQGGSEWHVEEITHHSGAYLVAGTACNAGLLPSYARPWDADYGSRDEALQELLADIEEQETGGSPSGELLSWRGSMVI
jgi:hypothetical protein